MKLALVHDYLNQYGGAERVLECFMDLFPDAPVYTIVANLDKMPARFKDADIRTSIIQHLPFSKRHFKKMLPFFPQAVEHWDLNEYDIVLSTSSAFAKGVLTKPNQLHVCYCHTPMRFVWDLYHQYIHSAKGLYGLILPSVLHRIRLWDQLTAQRVDHFIANSHNVAARIRKYYGREASVLYPPVRQPLPSPSMPTNEGNYYLVVSRLIPYKRVDLVIRAFNQLGLPLVVIGEGYDRKRLEDMAGPHIKFLGFQPDEVVAGYFAGCKALIFAGEEDLGITPLEAQSYGKPVIAYGKGGALETVVHGRSGLFFNQQQEDAVIEKVQEFERISSSFNPADIRKHAMLFNEEAFKRKFIELMIDITHGAIAKMPVENFYNSSISGAAGSKD